MRLPRKAVRDAIINLARSCATACLQAVLHLPLILLLLPSAVLSAPAIAAEETAAEAAAPAEPPVELRRKPREPAVAPRAATAPPDAVLLESGKPDAAAVVRLVRQLEQRDPAVREAAIRRLLPAADVARTAVAEVFRDGRLAARLSALELLREWRAPVEGLDPWRPETLAAERMAALEKWAAETPAAPLSRPEKLSDAEQAAAAAQIERMLKVSSEEADAIRQRLARLGPALLPEVYARLKQAGTDQERERLLALRYRLVAADPLALSWPDGLVRLAATDSRQRQKAAEELAQRATGEDQRLLLELFSDPDPLVREVCLRGLQHIGGKAATVALVELLADPEPNVRAAVLKQLEESPQPGMVPKVAEYLKGEKDPDLIVHALRFLRAAGGPAAVKAMMPLLKHESWQVRAEAAAGLGRSDAPFRLSSPGGRRLFSGPDGEENSQVEAYVALIELLDDRDAFVVSKAVEGLSGADMAVAVEPLVKAAAKHPDLAASIVGMLAQGNNMRAKALPHLREFSKHSDAAIRVAALQGLAQAAPHDMEGEVSAGLADAESQVRIAAAAAIFQVLETQRAEAAQRMQSGQGGIEGSFAPLPAVPESLLTKAVRLFGGALHKPPADAPAAPEDAKAAEEPAPRDAPPAREQDATQDAPSPAEKTQPESEAPWDGWLKGYYAGKHRPKWAEKMVGPLEKVLAAEAPAERMAAAQALVPLGKAELALPALLGAARAEPGLFDQAVQVLPWLVWDVRLGLFRELRTMARQEEDLGQLVHGITAVPDRRAADTLWELLANDKLSVASAAALETGLRQTYLGPQYFSPSDASPADRRELVGAAKPRALAGPEPQRLATLAILAQIEPTEAAEVARKLADDRQLNDALRRDAFQVLLVTLDDEAERTRLALDALAGPDADRRKMALAALAGQRERLATLRGAFYLQFTSFVTEEPSFGGSNPIIPKPPAGLKAEHLRPLAAGNDREVAAYAGYLLALLGEPEGMDALVGYWRDKGKEDESLHRLVYRAIAVLDEPKYVPVLKEIYGGLEAHRVRDFYWTIRIMSGPEVLQFRKEIRDKAGMENLR